jgi:tripartite-type tricarboxylate transporter receptor subunit TctC
VKSVNSILAVAALGATFACGAQPYPSKPIRVLFPYPGGSVPDAFGRQASQGAAAVLGQPLVFENRAGANGIIGTEAAAKAVPDGYTIQWTTTSAFIANSFLVKTLPYHPLKDFAAITNAGDIPFAVMVHASIPVSTVREFIDYSKKHPGKLTFGSFGNGSGPHLYGEVINLTQGTNMLHVPFKGAAAVVTDFVAGRVDATYLSIASLLPHWKAGKIKVLAIASPKRHPALPDLPSVIEDVPGFQLIPNWMGFVAPAQVPRPIVNQLHAAIMKSINTPDFRKRLDEAYYTAVASTPDEFAAQLKADFAASAVAYKAARIQPE